MLYTSSVKLRRPGISTNLCVHKYFYERSPIWQQVAEEEKKAVSEEQGQEQENALSDEEADDEETKPFEPVHFDPIDSRHLSSMPLLKARLTKLLKNCPHYMHTSSNIMLKIVSPVVVPRCINDLMIVVYRALRTLRGQTGDFSGLV